ncbi:Glucose-6-phosphate isomerase, partial [hydrothermal vent metagenome]
NNYQLGRMNQRFLEQWLKLEQDAKNSQFKDLQSLFACDSQRLEQLSFTAGDIFIDFSKNWLTHNVLSKLLKLAKFANLTDKINALFNDSTSDGCENKVAGHINQRKFNCPVKTASDRNKMFAIARKYTTGQWCSAFGKQINTIVNIGIGGSYLGPKLAVEALTELQTNNLTKILFYPSIDLVVLQSILQNIDLTTTLFCISSKSLGTTETNRNTATIIELLNNTDGYQPTTTNQSLVVATASFAKATQLNIPASHIMLFDNAIGGRFSVWSSIGFPLLMAIGEQKFIEFLAGAEKMDQHFHNTKLDNNIPVIMALISIWYRNFMCLPAYAVIPYDARLQSLPAWLQQLMMESNGKMHDVHGENLTCSSSPWLFGDHGQLSQHAFFQAFHQGTDVLPIDFIGVMNKNDSRQDFLLINMLAQSAALMSGSHSGQKISHCPGNRPSTTLLLTHLSASSLGQLLALYEHMIFVQATIWNINCFDQPGVELGKQIARNIVKHMEQGSLNQMHLDESTKKLLSRVINNE